MFDFLKAYDDDDFDDDEFYDEKPRKKNNNNSTPNITKFGSQVIVLKPKTINEANQITNNLLDGSAVVINLLSATPDNARRIIDFASGTCYAINGNLQFINEQILIASPKKVTLSGDFMEATK